MDIHFHKLTGCAPNPLANYLKALGILRLIAEQADPNARGAWRDESFVLATTLTETKLDDFFLKQYKPTPLISPWNSGSGFLKENAASNLLKKFEKSPLERLEKYKEGIKAARSLCSELSAAKQAEVKIKNEVKIKQLSKEQRDELRNDPDYKARLNAAQLRLKRLKESFIPECRLHWRGLHLEWLDAAVILKPDLSTAFPSLLGSGGNDGNLDFTDNFRQRFAELFDLSDTNVDIFQTTRDLLSHALFGHAVLGTDSYAIGQYSPGVAGGANSTNGLDGEKNVNPWDFILLLEGTLLFVSSASYRYKNNQSLSGAAPFQFAAQSIEKHFAAAAKDKKQPSEQWMPIWPRFASLKEIQLLFREGRAQLGRFTCKEPVEMGRAVARLGVTRGINAFERYGYLKRNGDSRFAVDLGRWHVSAQPRQELLNDLDTWLVQLHRKTRGKEASHSLVTAVKNLDEAILAATADATMPLRWQNILQAIADMDLIAARGGLDGKDPSGNRVKGPVLRNLRPGWITAADDGSPEFRLAVALASQYGIRRHWLPVNQFGRLDDAGAPSVVCHGRDLTADCIAFINRRLIEAAGRNSRALDQTPVRQDLCADLRDITVFLQGGLDLQRLLRLARGFMAIDTKALKEEKIQISRPEGSILIDDVFALFRLCLLPEHLKSDIPARADIFRRLFSGNLPDAARLAAGHLHAHGTTSPIQTAAGDARLIAASLAFPLSRFSLEKLVNDFSMETTIINKELEKHES